MKPVFQVRKPKCWQPEFEFLDIFEKACSGKGAGLILWGAGREDRIRKKQIRTRETLQKV
jgi:hypothetical protein